MALRKTCVLVVDDNVRMLRLMTRILELEGYRVLRAINGVAALDVFDEETPDLVLLDIIMPVMDGYTACRRIREFSQIPIIMVTAKGNEEEIVEGLNAGADDYVPKPFPAKELAARVGAVLRRTKLWEERSQPAFQSADLAIDFARHVVTVGGQEVNLTAMEYKMLSYLARNAGRVVIPDDILSKVWGEEYCGETHIIQVNMARLRKKLGDDAKNPKYIMTRPGIGYSMIKQI
jgi:DNA-binding response OmpR family regulator